ncbi:MAG: hypothetical protein QM775_00110 [Pirellulales bacterium]
MPTTLQNDVDFYCMVHEVLRVAQNADQEEAESEDDCRRVRDRQPFACRQWIAPLADGAYPSASSYQEVACRDISTGGFSYVSLTIPNTEKISVRLGKGDGWMYLTAGVVHCRPIDTPEGHAFLIGCKFLGRAAG